MALLYKLCFVALFFVQVGGQFVDNEHHIIQDVIPCSTDVDDMKLKQNFRDSNDVGEMITPLINDTEVEQEEHVNVREIAEDILNNLSVDYVQDFVREKLENNKSNRHASRANCLCQYAEARNIFTLAKAAREHKTKIEHVKKISSLSIEVWGSIVPPIDFVQTLSKYRYR